MKKMWLIFVGDVRRAFGNVVSVICVIGLVAIPSLFAWFNIAASWDPFGNLKNLKFAVANVDEGYKSDLIPLKVSVGGDVVDALRANSQLDWTITSKEDALDGTKSGKYYAAIVIPKDFSEHMMTFFSDGGEHAKLDYYRNEKLSALAPNLTGEGADEVAAQVNQTFVTTLTSAALNIATSLADMASTPEASRMLSSFTANVGEFATQLKDTGSLLGTYRSLTDSAQSLLNGADALLKQSGKSMDEVGSTVKNADTGADDMTAALNSASDTLESALKASADGFAAVGDDLDKLVGSANTSVADAASALRNRATAMDDIKQPLISIRDDLQALRDKAPLLGLVLDPQIASLQRSIDRISAVQNALNDAAAKLEQGQADTQQTLDQIDGLIGQAKDSLGGVQSDFSTALRPQVDQLSRDVTDTLKVLDDGTAQLHGALDDLGTATKSAGDGLKQLRSTLGTMSSQLNDAGDTLANFQSSLSSALGSGDLSQVRELLGGDVEGLASALAAPVQLKRKALFPVANFGSTMAPYYTFVPLWTASLLIAMTLNTSMSRRRRLELGDPRPHQLFLGHFGIFALISLIQSTVSCAGSLLFLRVQAVHPLLFMLSGWISGLLFVLFAYTLVVSFGNVGKAIGMLLLVFQVSGSAGSYPSEVLPGFMQWLSPMLPITHSINAMRAAIAGVYDNDFWREIGVLLLFVPPLLLLGLLLRKPLVGFNRWIDGQLEKTKLIA